MTIESATAKAAGATLRSTSGVVLKRTGKSTIAQVGRDECKFSGKTVKKDGLGARLKALFSSKSELHRLANKDKLTPKERVRFAKLKERRLKELKDRQWGDSNGSFTNKHKEEIVFLNKAEQRLGIGGYKQERDIARTLKSFNVKTDWTTFISKQ